MCVIRVNDLEELRAKVAETQKALALLYLDDQVWGGARTRGCCDADPLLLAGARACAVERSCHRAPSA